MRSIVQLVARRILFAKPDSHRKLRPADRERLAFYRFTFSRHCKGPEMFLEGLLYGVVKVRKSRASRGRSTPRGRRVTGTSGRRTCLR